MEKQFVVSTRYSTFIHTYMIHDAVVDCDLVHLPSCSKCKGGTTVAPKCVENCGNMAVQQIADSLEEDLCYV